MVMETKNESLKDRAIRYALEETDSSEYTSTRDDTHMDWEVMGDIMASFAILYAAEVQQALLAELKNHTNWDDDWWAEMKIDEFIEEFS